MLHLSVSQSVSQAPAPKDGQTAQDYFPPAIPFRVRLSLALPKYALALVRQSEGVNRVME